MKFFALNLLLSACVLAVGCQPAKKPRPKKTPRAAHKHGDGHHVHDYEEQGDEEKGHGVGPHDGTIADWGGGKFHVEFTVDHDQQQATVFVLGSDEKTPASIDAESIELSISDPAMQVTLDASPQEGDPEGKASRFIGKHEKLGVVQEYAGTMSGVVEGTPYSGDFAEVAHDEHAH
ncbi:hypothetical protein [Rhodopirellula sp. MGV]|uniref:hypothetical protein n=1 Tax=Rhodopirellula sp. MGV TaxID=2023130 RepID=UPI000B973DD3|nr:hypothetical protein [Rhodopirellula sp. MGV]OYP38210.1 hypothetical protein CGZ80_03040 [Rhodopirellula sp. MGV]PNY38547.1 hypothetical protein C2E31_01085 [Rhodopirellula baltica]